MSANIEDTVINAVKESKIFAMQIDESTDSSSKAQLLAFIQYIIDEKITEQFLCCKELEEKTAGKNIFAILTNYLEESGLSWKKCIGICTDGAPCMIGSIKEFISLASSLSFGLFPIRGRHSRYLHFCDMAFVLRSDVLPATNPLFRGKTGPPIFHIKVEVSC